MNPNIPFAHTPRKQPGPVLKIPAERTIEWRDYDRIAPGVYPAYCRWAKQYYDPGLRRWTCLFRFDVLSNDLIRVIARVPMWLNLGNRDRPRAGRLSRYFKEWIRANGRPPVRRDRLSPMVFTRRMCRVEIADTTRRCSLFESAEDKRLGNWLVRGHSVSKSHSQGVAPRISRGMNELQEINGRNYARGEAEGWRWRLKPSAPPIKLRSFGPSRGRGSLTANTQGTGES
jgi:hypothetical protein